MRSRNKYFFGLLGLTILAVLLMLGSHARELSSSKSSQYSNTDQERQTRVRALEGPAPYVSKATRGDAGHISSSVPHTQATTQTESAPENSKTPGEERFLAKLLEIKEREGKDNALIYYVRASMIMPVGPNEQQSELMTQVLAKGWDDRAQSLLPYMLEYLNAFELIKKGNDIEYARGIGLDDGFDTPVPNLLRIQLGSKMLAVYGRYLESHGNTGEASLQYTSALKMGAHFRSDENFIITNLIGTAGEHIAVKQLGRLAATGALNPNQVRFVLDTITAVEQTNGDLEKPFRGEMSIMKALPYRMAENPQKYLSSAGMPDMSEEQKNNVRALAADPDRYSVEIQYIEDQFVKYHSVPYWERTEAMKADLDALLESLSEPVKKLGIGNTGEMELRHLTVSSKLRQTMIAAALQDYRSQTGKYPDRLEQLPSKGYFYEVPIDPFSGKSFHYSVNNGTYELGGSGPKLGDAAGQPLYDPTNGTSSGGIIRLQ